MDAARLRRWLGRPATRRWGLVTFGMALAHALVLGLMAPGARTGREGSDPRAAIPPIFLDITPRVRPARLPTDASPSSDGASVPPPVAVRPAASAGGLSDVAPFVVETPPAQVRPTRPGRVIPESWRDRCGLDEGEVSDADWRACRETFLRAATPTDPPRRRRGDPAQDFAAQGAARIAAYEAQRAPAPTGSGNAGPSSTPGSNFGMGDMDRSVVYGRGSRPEVRGGID